MQAYKVKGKVDEAGNLVVTEPVKITPGDVEVIVWHAIETVNNATNAKSQPEAARPKRQVECSIPILKEWLENTDPVPPNFDPDRAKWEYLKEKHNL
ncbi:hypothetical protein [Argonema galeatum]|uniref:hypothetical protein n=1 Tax=Argonema galeatum TaxID=2942762 RepID=UPI002012E19D|nr:hypothetical protein [Argonema galeatum]MCL1467970.1 hypothetical protein [Argonema galeatum A003/A1]